MNFEYAFRCIVTGYFLKMVVADNLSSHTSWIAFPVYKSLSTVTGMTLLFGYSMQIFADFAGYSLIGIGLATLFGYDLPQNFNFPYISRSLSEFWRRWHISLSTWLRDYLYFPLGGNKKGPRRTYINLALVMVLGGLWHGAAWSYAVWGAYHGLGLAVERFFTREESAAPGILASVVRAGLVFTFVTLGWLLFKLPDFHEALEFLSFMKANLHMKNDLSMIAPVLLFSIPVVVYHLTNMDWLRERRQLWIQSNNRPYRNLVVAIYSLMIMSLVLNYGNSSLFIYFQF